MERMTQAMWRVFLLLLLQLAGSAWAGTAPVYYRQDLFQLCPSDGSKREISLRTTSAIFTLEVPPTGLPGGTDFNCHLELEAPSTSYGFHVYMEEMNLMGTEEADCPLDYLRFSRDDLIFTTYRSPKYCGVRPRVNTTNEGSTHRYQRGTGIGIKNTTKFWHNN